MGLYFSVLNCVLFPLEISQKQLENGLITNYEVREHKLYTPCIAFRHLPPNSARFSYATEGALFISTQLSNNVVSALRKVWVLIRLWKEPSAQTPT